MVKELSIERARLPSGWVCSEAHRSHTRLLTHLNGKFSKCPRRDRNHLSRIEQPRYCPNTKSVAHLSLATVDRPGPKVTFARYRVCSDVRISYA